MTGNAGELTMPVGKQRDAEVSWTPLPIDVMNRFEFPDGKRILRQATAAAPGIAGLKQWARKAGIPTIYVLPRHLGASSLIFAGCTTNSCIQCSAHDANMRNYKIVVAADCCAARSQREHQQAFEHIGAMADAKVLPGSALRLRQRAEKAHR